MKVSDFFNMENADGLHKFPVSGGYWELRSCEEVQIVVRYCMKIDQTVYAN